MPWFEESYRRPTPLSNAQRKRLAAARAAIEAEYKVYGLGPWKMAQVVKRKLRNFKP